MIFELAKDFTDALAAMPHDHPKRRTIELFEEAIRRDNNFIDHHPTTLFQCMWNLCWWYDCPEAAKHDAELETNEACRTEPEPPQAACCDIKLSDILENWLSVRKTSATCTSWFRSQMPPHLRLGRGIRSVLRVHSGAVTDVVFSPDGKHLASSSADKSICLWDSASGRLLWRVRRHDSCVNCVAFSADGKLVATGSGDATLTGDNSIRLWDTSTGGEVRCLRGHSGSVTSLSFSPNGLIASGSLDRTVRLWDSRIGRPSKCIQAVDREVTSVVFSPDGESLAIASKDKTIRVWRLKDDVEVLCIDGHKRVTDTNRYGEYVSDVAFSDDGEYLASSGAYPGYSTTSVCLWKSHTGTQLWCRRPHKFVSTAVDISPLGHSVASAGSGVVILDVKTGSEIGSTEKHSSTANCVKFSPCGDLIVIGYEDGAVEIRTPPGDWNSSPIQEILGHKHIPQSVHLSHSLAYAASLATGLSNLGGELRAEQRLEVCIWDLSKGKLLFSDLDLFGTGALAKFSQDDRLFAFTSCKFGFRNSRVEILDLSTGNRRIIDVDATSVTGFCFLERNTRIAVATQGGVLSLWELNLDSVSPLCRFPLANILDLRPHQDQSRVIVHRGDQGMFLFDWASASFELYLDDNSDEFSSKNDCPRFPRIEFKRVDDTPETAGFIYGKDQVFGWFQIRFESIRGISDSKWIVFDSRCELHVFALENLQLDVI